ncbi:phage antirepressor KilAC domain-containing protein [Mycobacterium tuberculosis]|uniref:BRO family protein n=1 Tax=Mycobacterium tuberculosis TaxID=1773 RepID=UPI0011268F1F
MTTLTPFQYGATAVRTAVIDGEPHFVAADLCAVLEIGRQQDATRYLDADEKRGCLVDTPSGPQTMVVVTEAGMYSLVLRSRKPEAKAFKRWLTHEVLPAIRKTGSYSVQRELTEDEIIHQALTLTVAKVEALEAKVAEDAAKVLCESGQIEIGEKRLVKALVDWGYLYRDAKGRPHVYQRYIEQGLFVVKARTYRDLVSGEVRESAAPQVRLTGKGLGVVRSRLTNQPAFELLGIRVVTA